MWVVTVHETTESLGTEPEDVIASFGGFHDKEAASEFSSLLFQQLSARHSGCDWYTQWFEMPKIQEIDWPAPSAELIAEATAQRTRPPSKSEAALDLRWVADKIANEEKFDLIPPPPSDAEIAAAIASVTGAS